MAAMRVTGIGLAMKVGMSQNYLAKRLRDEMSFTLDDVEKLVSGLDIAPSISVAEFIVKAVDLNLADVRTQLGAEEEETDNVVELHRGHNRRRFGYGEDGGDRSGDDYAQRHDAAALDRGGDPNAEAEALGAPPHNSADR